MRFARCAGVTIIQVAAWVAVLGSAFAVGIQLRERDQQEQDARMLAEHMVTLTQLAVDHYVVDPTDAASRGVLVERWPASLEDFARVFAFPNTTAASLASRFETPLPRTQVSLATNNGTLTEPAVLHLSLLTHDEAGSGCTRSRLTAAQMVNRGFPRSFFTVQADGDVVNCVPGDASTFDRGEIVVTIPAPEQDGLMSMVDLNIAGLASRFNASMEGHLNLRSYAMRDVSSITLANGTAIDATEAYELLLTHHVAETTGDANDREVAIVQANFVSLNTWYFAANSVLYHDSVPLLDTLTSGVIDNGTFIDRSHVVNGQYDPTINTVLDFGVVFRTCDIQSANLTNMVMYDRPTSVANFRQAGTTQRLSPYDDAWAAVETLNPVRYVAEGGPAVGFLADDFMGMRGLALRDQDGWLKLAYYETVPIMWAAAREVSLRLSKLELNAQDRDQALSDAALALRLIGQVRKEVE